VLTLAARLRDHLKRFELLGPGERLGIACSGGADSTALLRLLLELREELGIVLAVLHFNHQLRGAESDQDEHFVAELAHRYDLEFFLDSADTAGYARAKNLGLEAAARDLRYAFFAGSASKHALDKAATAHTLDDQAETVLMRIIRGTGLRGLGGIYPRVLIEAADMEASSRDAAESEESSAEIIRPLLGFRRRELEAYLTELGQSWRTDSSNADPRFTRNRVRAQLLPLLEGEFNPAVTANLAELADIARTEEDYWENEVAGWMGTGIHWIEPEWARPATGAGGDLVQLRPTNPELRRRLDEDGPLVMDASVDLVWFLSEPRAIEQRIVKAIGDLAGFPLEFKHVEEVLHFAEHNETPGKHLALPLGWKVERTPDALVFRTPDLRIEERIPEDYAYGLTAPGVIKIPEAGIVLAITRVECEPTQANTGLEWGTRGATGYNRDQLLDPAAVSEEITVRNWRAGDRFWPAHTKAPKKIKELLQERGVTGEARKRWPVLECRGELIWLRGFPTPAALQPADSARHALWVHEADEP
jgi:tRNA(Ile)-lysidine synthase